jgi:hypothetical protein
MSPSAALSVRCLGCGSVYLKPLGHGTASDNPGCPRCSYVGWIPTEQSFRAMPEPLRFSADPPQHPSWPSR